MTTRLSGADGSPTDEGAMKPKDLDDLLASARHTRAEPSAEFLSRLLVDAYANMPEPAAAPAGPPVGTPTARRERREIVAQLL